MTEKITYYTTPDTIYDNDVDVVKGTSLSGKEVDKNFNTLEGRDIKGVAFSEDKKTLFFTLWNNTTISCDSPISDLNSINADYNRETGVLTFCVNGDLDNPVVVSGFMTPESIQHIVETSSVFTDNTLEGNGTITSPLHIARMEKTGVYKPIKDIVDELPEDATVGDRYVINDEIDMNGSLYNYNGVRHIIQYLESIDSDWHVARKVDFDDMLNAFEPNPIDRTHCSTHTPDWLGEYAGAYVSKPEYGFNVNYCGYATEEEDMHVVWNNKREIWWTASHERGRSAYVKRLDKNNDAVYQDIIDGDQYFSVRLVRDITPSETYGAEEIMGKNYQVVAMPSIKQGLRLWINVNFNSELLDITEEVEVHEEHKDKCSGTVTVIDDVETVVTVAGHDSENRYKPEEWESQPVTYLCEYDGTKWIKQQINDYDAFFVENANTFYYFKDGAIQPIAGGNSTACTGTCSTITALTQRVAALEAQLANMNQTPNTQPTTREIIDAALSYTYTDYNYVGTFNVYEDNTIGYTPGSTQQSDILNDFARFFGGLYRGGNVATITVAGQTYTWTPGLNLKGSNYSVDGTLDTTLMKHLVTLFNTNPNGNLTVSFGNKTITLNIEY